MDRGAGGPGGCRGRRRTGRAGAGGCRCRPAVVVVVAVSCRRAWRVGAATASASSVVATFRPAVTIAGVARRRPRSPRCLLSLGAEDEPDELGQCRRPCGRKPVGGHHQVALLHQVAVVGGGIGGAGVEGDQVVGGRVGGGGQRGVGLRRAGRRRATATRARLRRSRSRRSGGSTARPRGDPSRPRRSARSRRGAQASVLGAGALVSGLMAEQLADQRLIAAGDGVRRVRPELARGVAGREAALAAAGRRRSTAFEAACCPAATSRTSWPWTDPGWPRG